MGLVKKNTPYISEDSDEIGFYTSFVEGSTNEKEESKKTGLQSPRLNVTPQVMRGGKLSANNGANCVQYPYLIITRPTLSLPENYGHYHGYPSNITRSLGSLTGYTQVGDIHLENIGCSKSEEDMLYSLLREGIIIRDFGGSDPSSFTIFKNKSDEKTVGKDLQTLGTISSIKLKKETSVNSPTFLLTGIDSYISNMNYIYYPEFSRYYFIRDISSVRNGLWAVSCEVDVLQTYRSQLANQTGVIERQEFVYNLYLNDGTLKAYSKPQTQLLRFSGSFQNQGITYIIVGYGAHGGSQ